MRKYIFTILMLLITSSCIAGTVLYDRIIITFNDKYSGKDFSEQSFVNATDLKSGTIIYASVFYQENKPNEHIFPEDMVGVTFYNCNLVNVYIPFGNTVIGGQAFNLKVQNDLEDWILDAQLKPVEPMDKEQRIEKGVSILPKDIPAKKFTEEERCVFEKTYDTVDIITLP